MNGSFLVVDGLIQRFGCTVYSYFMCQYAIQGENSLSVSQSTIFPTPFFLSVLKILKEFDLKALKVRSSSQSECIDSAQNLFYALTPDPVWGQGEG